MKGVQPFAEGAAGRRSGVECIADLYLDSPLRESSIDSVDRPSYSSIDSYVETTHTYEQIAIGAGFSDIDFAVESRLKEMEEAIQNRFDSFGHLMKRRFEEHAVASR